MKQKEEALGFDYCPHCGKETIEEKLTYENLSLIEKKEVLCMLRKITYGLEEQYGDTWEKYNKALLIIEHDIETEEERIEKINEFLDSLDEDEKESLLLSVLIGYIKLY